MSVVKLIVTVHLELALVTVGSAEAAATLLALRLGTRAMFAFWRQRAPVLSDRNPVKNDRIAFRHDALAL